jgi:subtilisin family serine protease
MQPKWRFPNSRLAVPLAALFATLAGTAVAANVVPAGHGTRFAVARSEAPVVPERPQSALLRNSAIHRAGAARATVNRFSGEAVAGLHATGPLRTHSGLVRMVVETSRPGVLRAGVRAAGGHVERSWNALVQVTVPAAAVSSLAELDGVGVVRPPLPLVEHAINGEEVGASLASSWHQSGLTGRGVKVAVIDGGFAGLARHQASGDLPANVVTRDFCAGDLRAATDHGTAVAQIVHEMAPDAQLYLLCIATDVDLAAAEAFAESQGVQVINLSAGFYNAGRGDGDGPVGAIAADARAAGILWVNSAGNDAQTHWSGTFTDINGDRIHEFGPGDIGNTFLWEDDSVVCGALKWDEWPAGASDFDLFLIVSSTGQLVGGSVWSQTGTQPPTEGACLSNDSGSDAVVAWVIAGYTVRSAPRFDLFSISLPLEHQTAAGSIGDPASSPAVLAVGALCWETRTLEPYSSQGPTIDGRTKPDLVAHDSVSGAVYGRFAGCPSAFAGTSASSPEVAGAAALVKQAFPAYGPDQLQAFLVGSALDLGTPGPDNATGAGELRLPAPPDRLAPQATALASVGRAGRMVTLRSRASDESGRVHVVEQVVRNGKVIATLRSAMATASGSTIVATSWHAAVSAAGRFQHCVRAKDDAGNTSARSCAAIRLR